MEKIIFSNICMLSCIQISRCLKGLFVVVVHLFALLYLFCIAFHQNVPGLCCCSQGLYLFCSIQDNLLGSGNFTILTRFSTILLVKYECLLFATVVTPLM